MLKVFNYKNIVATSVEELDLIKNNKIIMLKVL